MDLSIYLWYYSAAGIYFSFRWGPFVHSLEIVQWYSTRRDHPGYPGRVSGSGLVTKALFGLNPFYPHFPFFFPFGLSLSIYFEI